MSAQQMPPAPQPGWSQPPMGMAKPRPIGVTILAILTILFGIIGLIGGLLVIVGSALIASVAPEFASVAGIIAILGALLAVISLAAIAAGIGLWRLRPWAWWLTMIVGVLSILSSIGSFVVFPVGGFPYGIVLWVIVLIYLVLVREHFGIGAPRQPGMPQAPPM